MILPFFGDEMIQWEQKFKIIRWFLLKIDAIFSSFQVHFTFHFSLQTSLD